MSRKIALGLGAALFLGAATISAPQAHEVYAKVEVYDEHCPDTYCGNRAYPDPYIRDGFRHSPGYRGAEYYRRNSWYDQRLARPRTVKVRLQHQHQPQELRLITK
jgi:hypothetical protein